MAATAALKKTPALGPDGRISPTLRRHKSQKSIKLSDIGAPQLVATSANLARLAGHDGGRATSPPPVPVISPKHMRKQSSTAALRSKFLRKGSMPNGEEISPYNLPLDSPSSSTPNTPDVSFDGHSPHSSAQNSPARAMSPVSTPGSNGGFGRVLSRFRKSRPSDADSPRSPPASTPSQPTTPDRATRPLPNSLPLHGHDSVGLGLGQMHRNEDWRTQRAHPTFSDLSHTAPLHIRARSPPTLPPLPTPPMSAPASSGSGAASRHDSGHESIRQLMQAAADLGIDADKVNDLIRSSFHGDTDPASTVVRRTIILSTSDAEKVAQAVARPPPASLVRSQTWREGSSPASSPPGRHRRTSSEAALSTKSPPRSVTDRPPTPPPDAHQHRRRRSSDLQRAPMPPTMPASPSLNSIGEHSALPSGLAPPLSSPNHRGSFRSSRTPSSYAGSLFDFYGDDLDEGNTLVLASGRIPSPGEASISSAPRAGLPASAISSAAAAGARVEVDEMQDGSLVWQVRFARASLIPTVDK